MRSFGLFPVIFAEAYLVLAFLGMCATEFIARAAYRPAYLAHAAGSLLPLAVMLTLEGGLYQTLSAMLVIFFGGVLYTYCGGSRGRVFGREHSCSAMTMSNSSCD